MFDVVEDKPVLHCLVGWRLPNGAYVVRQGAPLTLEGALLFSRFGWEVIVDPFDQAALARWEMLNRPRTNWQKW